MASSAAGTRPRPPPPPPRRLENPFNVKVFQVFTGFGVGCGVGVGVGRPIYLGAIPLLQQVMSATRGATDAFSGIGRHANTSLRKLGLKNIEVGVGCGVGIGHGFGVGIALKPGVLHGIQSSIAELISKTMSHLKEAPGFSSASNLVSGSLPTSISTVGGSISSVQISDGTTTGLESKTVTSGLHQRSGEISLQEQMQGFFEQNGMLSERTTGSQTGKVLANFLQNPLLQDDIERGKGRGNLEATNNMLQMLLQHQQVIQELIEENQKLRQVIIEDLHVSPSKLQLNHRSRISDYYPCSGCFECRRRSRKAAR